MGQALGVMSDKQVDARLMFERRNRGRNRRLRNANAGSSILDAAACSCSNEIVELP